MVEKWSLRIFWIFMLTCALLVIGAIASGGEPTEVHARLIPITLILGVASFLIWAPHIVYRFIDAVGR